MTIQKIHRPALHDITEFADISEAFNASMFRLHEAPEASPRGHKTKELSPYSFYVLNPSHLFVFNPFRHVNPFAQIAETLWVLAGRNDLDWLERYIPSCKQWSDDGKTWRAGYGPRLRKWANPDTKQDDFWWTPPVDQVMEVFGLFNRDRSTRQAIISLWDPAEDWITSKDIPCNNWLQFIVRDEYLNLHVAVRSNDAVFGFSHVDFFQWAVLQNIMAKWIEAQPGYIYWTAGSFHIYERHFQMAQDIYRLDFLLDSYYTEYGIEPMIKYFKTSYGFFDEFLNSTIELVDWLWTFPFDFNNVDAYILNVYGEIRKKILDDGFFEICAFVLAVHRWHVGAEGERTMYVLKNLVSMHIDVYHAIIQHFFGRGLAAGHEGSFEEYPLQDYYKDLNDAVQRIEHDAVNI